MFDQNLNVNLRVKNGHWKLMKTWHSEYLWKVVLSSCMDVTKQLLSKTHLTRFICMYCDNQLPLYVD